MNTKHTCYRTRPVMTAAEGALWIMGSFLLGAVLALTLWADWTFPYLGKLLS